MIILLLPVIPGNCINLNFVHHVTAGTTIFTDNSVISELNYKPELSLLLFRQNNRKVDSEFIYNLNYSYSDESDFTSNLYRGWLRYASRQTEIRIGLQKINFGPAIILRSLQWFDRIDPQDPTQTTDGRKAILTRYYFLNNANLWFWGIWGDESETSISDFFLEKDNPELGGRIQFPFDYCEAAFSYNHKKIIDAGFENRFGLDARWDFEIGFWAELMVSHFSEADTEYKRSITLGADYTFSFGNGIYFLTEYCSFSQMKTDFFEIEENSDYAALSITYPLSIYDEISSLLTSNLDTMDIYYSFTYHRTYDYISFYINLYLNPEVKNFHKHNMYKNKISKDNSLQLLLQCDF
ncbi:MAG: hypothetical protein K9N07_08000 [Candidatus Cloacimonetes bacterium]|nr:hypothetical protein [Candidatus Cloacimonadota bacterium]